MKNIIKNILNLFGYKILNISERKKHTEFGMINYLLNLASKSNKLSKLIIFDSGGNTWEYSKTIETNLIKEKKEYEFYIFEPNLKLINRIKEKNIKNCNIYEYGLGNIKEKKIFWQHDKHVKSSFVKINKNYFERRAEYGIKNIEAEIETLDNFAQKNRINHINFLKIDTQGFNSKVLEGAKELINNQAIDFIYTECTLGKKYENSETFYDFEKILHNNYDLYGIDTGTYYLEVVSRRFFPELNLDLFYVSKRFHAKIPDSKHPLKK